MIVMNTAEVSLMIVTNISRVDIDYDYDQVDTYSSRYRLDDSHEYSRDIDLMIVIDTAEVST